MSLCIGQTPCIDNYRPLLLSLPGLPEDSDAVAQLTLPEPTFDSYKLPVVEHYTFNHTGFDIFTSYINPRLLFDVGGLLLSDDLPSAIEDYLSTHNLNLDLGINYKFHMGPVFGSLKYNFEWFKNVHLEADDTQRLIPLDLNAALEWPINQYVQIFSGGNFQVKLQQYKSPTLFYPNGNSYMLQANAGVQVNIPQWKTALALTLLDHEFSWFHNHEFNNVISKSFTVDMAKQWVDSFGVQFTKSFSEPAAPDITAYYKQNFYYGKRQVPEALAIGDKILVNSLASADVTRINAGLVLDWGDMTFALDYKYREFESWPAEHIVKMNIKWNPPFKTDIGNFGLGFGIFQINPTDPVNTTDVQINYGLPKKVLNKSLSLLVSFYDNHFAFVPSIDVMRFAANWL